MVDSFFGTPWRDLSLESVEAFLETAGDEGLTWEAKGTESPRADSVCKAVGAFANTVGGFLILGASRDGRDGPWRVDPIEFRSEPPTWLSQVICSGVRPVPRFDVRAWERDGRSVAVVKVDPVAEPPCMTTDGKIFMRVSGASSPVEDPTTLRLLFERGKARAASAEAEALRAAHLSEGYQPRENELDTDRPYLRLRLAFAPTGRVDDIGGRLFTRTFLERLAEAAGGMPDGPLTQNRGPQRFPYETTQDSVIVKAAGGTRRQQWSLQARWDASVAAFLDVQPNADEEPCLTDTAIFDTSVRPASQVLANLVRGLGGYGRAHVALIVVANRFDIIGVNGTRGSIPGPHLLRPIQAWTDADGQLSHKTLDRMQRELCRASGVVVWEPEPEAPPAG